MAEYIEREATIELLRSLGSRDYRREKGTIQEAIKMVSFSEYTPAADVAPVRHGRWVQVICHEEFEYGFVDRVKECCSVCHAPNWQRTTNYCPNCGAKMDDELNE